MCGDYLFCAALRETDVVFNAAALKQVPNLNMAPFEAVATNFIGLTILSGDSETICRWKRRRHFNR